MGRDHDRDRDRARDKKPKKSKDKRHRHRHRSDSDSSDTGPPRGVARIGDDDYFLRATEFRVWLKQRRNQYVEELSTDEAMRLFQTKFVKRWNAGRLDRMYYDGIPESVLESTKRTRHAWGFVQNLNDRERMDLASAKDSVGVATRKADLLVAPGAPRAREPLEAAASKRRRDHDGRNDDDDEEEDRFRRRRTDDKRARKHHESVMEELVPRETGREAMLEKRRQVADKVHGAARERDANRDGLDLDDAFLMGGKDDLHQRLARRADSRQRRDDDLRERAAAAQAKETARMDKFLQDMGLSANGSGRPMTIQPRRDA